tara:strand:+ start:1205 stop:2359 length:1155 start_codon:yes stop_codon:yes gene_type:complete
VPLKKPGELFEEKIEDEISIEETPVKIVEVSQQADSVSSSFASSLSEAIDKNLNSLSNEYSEKISKFNLKIDTLKEEINIKFNDFEKINKSLKGEIGIVEHRQQTNNFDKIKNEVISQIKKLEDKIDTIKEAYEENILNEPPSTDNEDPLTALDQKFVTLDKFEDHYKLFVNRIQKQLSTLGGGGAVNIRDLDDVDLSTAKVNDKYLKYDSSSSKWVGADASSGVTTEFVSSQNLNVVGFSTFNDDVVFNGNNTNMRWDHSTSDLILFDNTRLEFGSNKDFEIFHGGAHTFMKNSGGDLRIRGDKILLKRADDSERYLEANVNNEVKLFFNGNEKFATTNTGINVTGDAKVGVSTAQGVILTSPNGTEYRLIVADDGTLSTTAV